MTGGEGLRLRRKMESVLIRFAQREPENDSLLRLSSNQILPRTLRSLTKMRKIYSAEFEIRLCPVDLLSRIDYSVDNFKPLY